MAASHNHSDAIKILVKYGASLDLKNKSGSSPLFSAIASRSEKAGLTLISLGASVDLTNSIGFTPLMMTHQLALSRALIEKGAKVNTTSPIQKKTALMGNSEFGNFEIVRLLVKHGADLHLKDKYGKKAIDYARKRKHQDVVDFLSSAQTQGP